MQNNQNAAEEEIDAIDVADCAPDGDYSKQDLLKVCRRLHFKAKHVTTFADLFVRLDKDKSGTIEREEMFAWLKERYTIFQNCIFELVDAKTPGSLNFLEFLKAITTFVLFGAEEVLQFCFYAFDTDKNGYIDHSELHQLVEFLHGTPEERILNINTILRQFDRDRDGRIDFEEFRAINARHPYVLYPLFRLQNKMEKKTMGERWWGLKRKELVAERKMQEAIEQAKLDGIKPTFLNSTGKQGSFERLLAAGEYFWITTSPKYKKWLESIKQTSTQTARSLVRTLSTSSFGSFRSSSGRKVTDETMDHERKEDISILKMARDGSRGWFRRGSSGSLDENK